jgi:hypothetical protein
MFLGLCVHDFTKDKMNFRDTASESDADYYGGLLEKAWGRFFVLIPLGYLHTETTGVSDSWIADLRGEKGVRVRGRSTKKIPGKDERISKNFIGSSLFYVGKLNWSCPSLR